MNEMCKRGGAGCNGIAAAFYAAVVAKGKSSYRGGQDYRKKEC